jgi:hypothetical protein
MDSTEAHVDWHDYVVKLLPDNYDGGFMQTNSSLDLRFFEKV